MKKFLISLSILLFISGIVVAQNPVIVGQKQKFMDSLWFYKYKQTTTDSAVGLDANGRVKMVAVGRAGSGGTTYLISGAVIYDSVFTFHNTTLDYKILGKEFFAAASTFTIPSSDTLPRYSVIYADTLGNVGVLNGITTALPNIPQVNPLSQILLAIYYVPANSVAPSSGFPPATITNTSVYKENVEWTVGGTATGLSGAYTLNPYAGLLSTRVPALINGQYLEYTNGATVSASTFSYLSMELRLGAAFDAATTLAVTFYLDGSPVSNTLVLTSGSYGFTRTTTGAYQLIAFGINNFNFFGGALFNKVHISFAGANASGFQLDNVILQGGGTVINNSGVISYNSRTGNVLPLRTDNTWMFDSTALSSDSINYKFYNNGNLLSTLPTLKRNIIAISPLSVSNGTISDTIKFTGSTGGGGRYATNGYGITVDSSTANLYRIIADTTVLQSKIGNATLLGLKQNSLSGTGYAKWSGTTPFYLTPTQVTADLNLFSSTLQGLVPLSGGGTANFLRADGTWAAAGAGTVTSVSGTTNRITSTGGTTPVIDISSSYVGQSSITTLGTIGTGVWNGTKLSEAYGGTNQSTYTTGDILYASGANTLSKLPIGSSTNVLTVTGGVPVWAAATGASYTTQYHTSGATVTVTSTTVDWLIVNPASLLASLAVTLPVSPVDRQEVNISFGGTITSGTVVTALSFSPTPLQATTPSSVEAGESIKYKYNSSNTKWYRVN